MFGQFGRGWSGLEDLHLEGDYVPAHRTLLSNIDASLAYTLVAARY